MVRGYRLPLTRLTIDLSPNDARLERGGYQQVGNPPTKVFVEVAGTVVPPGVSSGLGMTQPVSINKSPEAEACERFSFTLGDMRSPMTGAGVPHIDVFRRHIEVATEYHRRVGVNCIAEPAR